MGSKNQADITGLTLRMANGQLATVVDYYNSKDMTIKFEDGTLKEHVYKVHFMHGKVANPSLGNSWDGSAYTLKHKKSILGYTATQNCGQNATCIRYGRSDDIDVIFEDGTIVEHRRKTDFMNGNIKNPNLIIGSILGKSNLMNCGLVAKVIADRGYFDIDVKFEDGSTVINRSRSDFINEEIACPSLPKYYSNRKHLIGEYNTMKCGMYAAIYKYRSSDDIDVIFEDGTIVTNKTVSNFKLGNINNPNYYRYSILGNELMMNCGMKCKVVEQDKNVTDITVEFEDGTIVEHKTKSEFIKRSIQNPNIPRFNSLPQAIVFYYIKKYFLDAICDYRPNWLLNTKTKYNFEIDIWIPSISLGIEYDGYIPRHTKCSWLGLQKLEAINNATEIKKMIVINEATTYIYESNKLYHYRLTKKSKRSEYRDLIIELYDVIRDILTKLGKDAKNISPYDIDLDFDDFDYGRFLMRLRELFGVIGIKI